jgi:hypothetical protein
MKRSILYAVGIATTVGLGLAVASTFAQPSGPGMGMGMGMGHQMGHAMGMGHGAGGMGTGHGSGHRMDSGMMMGMGPGMGRMRGGGPDGATGGHGPRAGMTAMLTTQDAGSAADMTLVHELLAVHDRIDRRVTTLPDGIRTVTESDDPKVAQAIQAHVASMSQRLGDGREFNLFSTTLPVLFRNRDKIESRVEMTGKGAIVTRTSTDPAIVAALQGHAAEVTELVDDGMVAMRRGMMSRMAMGPGGAQALAGGAERSHRGHPMSGHRH